MSRQTELEVAMSRLETKIDVMEMQINSTSKPGSWPGREAWRGLLRMAQQAVDEYHKEIERGPKEIQHIRKTSERRSEVPTTGQPD